LVVLGPLTTRTINEELRTALSSKCRHLVVVDAKATGQQLELAGARPLACFFIDDKLENVEAARELGFRATIFGMSRDFAAPYGNEIESQRLGVCVTLAACK
jgi:hypothetical protein